MNQEVIVSICCITYNQEKYIAQTIDSFLSQKTNFKYEIIIYDDASTDRTTEIIRDYEKRYPDIIKPIYSKENKYSKGKQTLLYPMQQAIGKYIAICEGDDYWIDDNKIQMQVDYMEKNLNCTFCFHNAYIRYENTKKEKKFINKKLKFRKYRKKDGNYNTGNIHLYGCGVAPTASFFFRTEYVKQIPDWFSTCICGDLPIKLIMTSFGYAHYIDKIMSVYRKGIDNSVTQQWNNNNNTIEKKVQHLNSIIKILDNVDKFTLEKYKEGLEKSKNYYRIEILMAKKQYKEIFKIKNFIYYAILTNDILGIKLIAKMLLKY